jgi:uncharacterized protein with PQ loop repeat
MNAALPTIAGTASTILFVVSYLPMLVKAVRTKDLASYSLGNLLIANVGNVVYSVYVFSLPFGPIWFLHAFYLVSTAAMLLWYRRYTRASRPARATEHWRAPSGSHPSAA